MGDGKRWRRMPEESLRDRIDNQTLHQKRSVKGIVVANEESKMRWAHVACLPDNRRTSYTPEWNSWRPTRTWRVTTGDKWFRIKELEIILLSVWLSISVISRSPQ